VEPWRGVRHVQGALHEVLANPIYVHVQGAFDFARVSENLPVSVNVYPRFKCTMFGVVADVAKLNALHVGLLSRACSASESDIG